MRKLLLPLFSIAFFNRPIVTCTTHVHVRQQNMCQLLLIAEGYLLHCPHNNHTAHTRYPSNVPYFAWSDSTQDTSSHPLRKLPHCESQMSLLTKRAQSQRAETLSVLTSCGTSLPSFMTLSSCCPVAEPDLTSSRSRSPADRWVSLYLATMRSHWVPLPLPGPPSTKMILVPAGSWPGVPAVPAVHAVPPAVDT